MFPTAAPRRILLATDLSCRCDRALDRAVQLAKQWNAELIAAHVMDPAQTQRYVFERGPVSWHRLPDPLAAMRWRLKRDIGLVADDVAAIVEEGVPAETLRAIADREGCDLIVTGVARDETLGRMFLGGTVNRLVRGARCPVLVVRNRAAHAYREIVVATDFSESSLKALLTGGRMFPTGALTLLHAYEVPFGGYLDDKLFKQDLRNLEKELETKFLADPRIDDDVRARVDVVIEHGMPGPALRDFVQDKGADLTVIGSHGRGALFDAVIGSTAKTLIEGLDGDLLIVRPDVNDP